MLAVMDGLLRRRVYGRYDGPIMAGWDAATASWRAARWASCSSTSPAGAVGSWPRVRPGPPRSVLSDQSGQAVYGARPMDDTAHCDCGPYIRRPWATPPGRMLFGGGGIGFNDGAPPGTKQARTCQ